MSPLINAVLGVLFVGVGAAATLLMYYLRGAPLRQHAPLPATPGPSTPAGSESETAAESVEELYLARWRRSSDDLERQFDQIHTIAETGRSIIEPMRSRKAVTSWDDLLIKGAQLATIPLNDDEPVGTRTILGPSAEKPLVIDTPIIVSHMSFGACRERSRSRWRGAVRRSARRSARVREGSWKTKLGSAHRYIFEYVPNRYSVTDENLRRVDAIEIKFGQSAKPGMGGHLPGNKVSSEIAAVRGRVAGQDIISPARFPDIHSRDDLRRLVDSLRQRSAGRPIGVKIAAGNLEADLDFALSAGPDFITVDGRAGATGAAPKFVKDATSIPTIYALCRARKFLDQRKSDHVSLVITGGLRISSDFAKALALGADAVAIASAALMASGCQQYRLCHTGKCPVGIATQDPELRQRLQVDKSARYLENFLRVSTEELKMFARLTGHRDVHDLSVRDICTTNADISNSTVIEHV